MLLSAVSVLVVAQSSSEVPEGLMNNSVLYLHVWLIDILVIASVIPTRKIITTLLHIILK